LNTLFGLSTTYHMAIATRFVLGALNGLLAPIKVISKLAISIRNNLVCKTYI
jgi:hypothetical protein